MYGTRADVGKSAAAPVRVRREVRGRLARPLAARIDLAHPHLGGCSLGRQLRWPNVPAIGSDRPRPTCSTLAMLATIPLHLIYALICVTAVVMGVCYPVLKIDDGKPLQAPAPVE